MTHNRTFEIADIDGKNRRMTTMAEFRADLDARAVYGRKIKDAFMRGDIEGVAAAQAEMRTAFPK